MDEYIRKRLKKKEIKEKYDKEIEFQILEWIRDDIINDEEENILLMKLFGVTDKGDSINLSVKGFEPFFYVKVFKDSNVGYKKLFLDALESKMYEKNSLNKDNCKIISRKVFYGFQNNDKFKFIKLCFKNLKGFYTARKILENPISVNSKSEIFELFEHKTDITLKFIHSYNVGSVGWVKFKIEEAEMSYDSKCQLDYELDVSNLVPLDRLDIAPFRQLSYDIECYSHDKDKFPQAGNLEDCVTQIGSTFQTFGKKEIDIQHIITFGNCNKLNTENAIVESYDTEKKVLLAWKDLINKTDPDIIYGYNNHGFDDNYLYKRASLNKIQSSFCDMSKLCNKKAKIVEATFNSSAYGNSKWNLFAIAGRINFDLLVYIRREFKLDGYKMDAVAKEYLTSKLKDCLLEVPKVNSNIFKVKDKYLNKFKLGQLLTLKDETEIQELGRIVNINLESNEITTENILKEQIDQDCDITLDIQKNPVTPKMIFSSFEEKDPEKIKEVADYCLQDTKIPLQLVDTLNIFINCIQMAIVTYVPFSYLVNRGQQIKIMSQVMKATEEKKYIIPTVEYIKPDFEGATVLPPDKGSFFTPVVVLDFASLYPSIIRAHNFCYTSIVLEPKYDNLEGVEYFTVEWIDNKTNEKFKYKYVQNTETIIPALLEDLTVQRKNVRKKMKNEEDKMKYMVMDGFQKALKVSANSIYGFFTSQSLQMIPLGSCTTAIGRQMIKKTKEYIDENYKDFHTIYGDSVIGKTPITLKDENNNIIIKYIEDINKEWKDYNVFKNDVQSLHSKEQSLHSNNFQVWSGYGWTPIRKVIRHKTNKKIYKVKTRKGVVYVTEDHSLLTNNKIPIKPNDCKIGDKLWHNKFNN